MARAAGLDGSIQQHLLPPVRDSAGASTSGEFCFSDFDVVHELGVGSFCAVSLVRHRASCALYALKTAQDTDISTAAEAEILGRVDSPHVVRCHAILRGASRHFGLLLELMDDRILLRRCRGLPEPALAEVAAQCLAGFVHLHSHGVTHLDIKLDNLLASTDGSVKIGDFGVAKIPAHEGYHCSLSAGTEAYMSPERYAPDAHASCRDAFAADVWRLGVTILELFLGRCPIAREMPSWGELKRAICDGDPPPVPSDAAASDGLGGFVAACLPKDPSKRATARQLLMHPFVAQRDVDGSRRALRELIAESL